VCSLLQCLSLTILGAIDRDDSLDKLMNLWFSWRMSFRAHEILGDLEELNIVVSNRPGTAEVQESLCSAAMHISA